jgi:hypothetical protein
MRFKAGDCCERVILVSVGVVVVRIEELVEITSKDIGEYLLSKGNLSQISIQKAALYESGVWIVG